MGGVKSPDGTIYREFKVIGGELLINRRTPLANVKSRHWLADLWVEAWQSIDVLGRDLGEVAPEHWQTWRELHAALSMMEERGRELDLVLVGQDQGGMRGEWGDILRGARWGAGITFPHEGPVPVQQVFWDDGKEEVMSDEQLKVDFALTCDCGALAFLESLGQPQPLGALVEAAEWLDDRAAESLAQSCEDMED